MNIGTVQKNAWSFVLNEPTRLLVADDDPILREFAIVHLSSPTATVDVAPDGASALAMMMSHPYDIVLLDISMPDADGFSVLEKIRAEPRLRHMPIMMLTGHEDIASIDHAFSLGANAFATKPVNWRLLSYHIRYVLRMSRVEQELRQAQERDDTAPALTGSTFATFEQECQRVLRAIMRQTEAFRADQSERADALATLERIERLATAALREWDDGAGNAGDSVVPALAAS
jgi:DNA-binding response OmpR family regulator